MKLRAGEIAVLAGAAVIAAFAGLVGVLIYLKPPPASYRYVENPSTRAGEAIYRREGCNSCHRLFGNGSSFGPALDGVGSRRTPAWLADYLRNPWPGVSAKPYRLRMPAYDGLTKDEMRALVTYLQALRKVGADGRALAPKPAPGEATRPLSG